jgi:hypothetical protein
VLGSWSFPSLGDGMNLAGITYRPDCSRFYMTAFDPSRVLSFPVEGPDIELRPESFELQNFFGDDMVWGIAWDEDQDCFWTTHVSTYGSGCMAARYSANGAFTGDTWNLTSIEPGAWFAGLDFAASGVCHAVEVGAGNRIYQLVPGSKQVSGYIDGPPVPYRACTFVGDHGCYLVSGGWNSNTVVRLDPTGSVLEAASLSGLADLDVYRGSTVCPDSLVWAYATTSTQNNTVYRISLGRVWSGVGVSSATRPAGPPQFRVAPNPAGRNVTVSCPPLPADARLSLWDAVGRLVRSEPLSGRGIVRWSLTDVRGIDLPSGIYLLTLSTPGGNLTRKLAVLGNR